ncbi:MAG: response regulator transcription factor [Alphaproteobacteria bacterium]
MKLLIADDHTLFRDALVQYITRAIKGVQLHVTKNFHEAYAQLKKEQDFDLVILDLRMPGMNEMKGFQTIASEYPDVKLALMSGVAETQDVEAAINAGAQGYFPKTLSGKALIAGILDVLAGNKYIPKDSDNKRILPSYYVDNVAMKARYSGLEDGQAAFDATKPEEGHDNLTPREKDVLQYLAKGASNKEIASELGLQLVTIKLHVRGICRKLEADNRTQAALKAVQQGLVETA